MQSGRLAKNQPRSLLSCVTGPPHPPWIRITGGTGVSYPSFTMSASTGWKASPWCAVPSLYASPHAGLPMLEIRIKAMCQMPPYNTPNTVARFTGNLRSLGIPRLDAEPDLAGKRPNIPLTELTGGRAERLLVLLDQWINDVLAHTTEPATTKDSSASKSAMAKLSATLSALGLTGS